MTIYVTYLSESLYIIFLITMLSFPRNNMNVLNVIKTREIDFVVILGDMLNDHNDIKITHFYRLHKFLEAISES